jgi:hypothetical protein
MKVSLLFIFAIQQLLAVPEYSMAQPAYIKYMSFILKEKTSFCIAQGARFSHGI